MYSFAIFEQSGVEPCGSAVAYGVSEGLLPVSAVSDYEEYLMASKGIDGRSDLLVFEGSPEEALAALSAAGRIDDGPGCEILRHAILAALDSDGQSLLDAIEMVYSDFGYPPDMDSLIYYMPNDGEELSPSKLVDRFRLFLLKEKDRLDL